MFPLKPNNAVTVKQFHLTNWPEGQELPESKKDLLDVMDLVERWQQQSGNGPVTIHCRYRESQNDWQFNVLVQSRQD